MSATRIHSDLKTGILYWCISISLLFLARVKAIPGPAIESRLVLSLLGLLRGPAPRAFGHFQPYRHQVWQAWGQLRPPQRRCSLSLPKFGTHSEDRPQQKRVLHRSLQYQIVSVFGLRIRTRRKTERGEESSVWF